MQQLSALGRIWVTRAEPGATATAGRLQAMSLEPLIAPLLEARRLPVDFALSGVTTLAFTSSNGVDAFAAGSSVRDLMVFTVGDATAETARAAGFNDVRSANGDMAALARLIVETRPNGAVLHPTAAEPAGDLAGTLVRAGIDAASVAVYETVAATALPMEAERALRQGQIAAVLIHSPRAAVVLRTLVTAPDLHRLLAVGLSPACIAPLEGLTRAAVAAETPREDALLATLGKALTRR